MIHNQNHFADSESRQVQVRLKRTQGDIPGCRKHYLMEAIPGMMPMVEQAIREFIDETKNCVEFAHAQQELQLVDYEQEGLTRLVNQYEGQPQMQTALNVAYEIQQNTPDANERLRQIVDHADSIAPSGSESFLSSQAPT
ncbi:hypothetical protein [Gimesia maris]|uniref:hypothetical protein n=1 Tax=Gimesia maris TaxID=122 RepID=UPI0032EB8D73